MKALLMALVASLAGITGAQAGCANRPTPAAMKICAEKAYQASDRRMNRVYQMAMKAQKGAHKKALRKAQRSWLVFRNRACKSYTYLGDKGKVRPLLYKTCLSSLTAQRTKMLQVHTIRFGN